MKIGIYITGLGQSFINESVEKYAGRLINEISYTTTGTSYELKTEKINYTSTKESVVVSILEKNGQGQKVIYKLYDFKYHKLLTERYNAYSIIRKNALLLLMVMRKIPIAILRLFRSKDFNHPFQTFYLFLIFFIVACAVLFMLPAILGIASDFYQNSTVSAITSRIKNINPHRYEIFKHFLKILSKGVVMVTSVILLLLPNANTLISSLASEFVCVNNYLEYGTERQLIQGNLEKLIEYISENEINCKIHFHTYSFGSILAIDYLFPFGNDTTHNAKKFSEALITIGTPVEFIKAYYRNFYKERQLGLQGQICWLNIYSITDALATNFRKDEEIGDAEFSIDCSIIKPTNLNYEVALLKKNGLINFIMLHSIKAHGMYWDEDIEGQSCLGLVYKEMSNKNLF